MENQRIWSMLTFSVLKSLFQAELRELEDKYKAAMMTSAQLDNEKQSLVYQVELLKDQLEEQDEGFTELQREFKEKSRVGFRVYIILSLVFFFPP